MYVVKTLSTHCCLSMSSSACIFCLSCLSRSLASIWFSSAWWLSAALSRCCSADLCFASSFSSCSMRRCACAISELSSSGVSCPSSAAENTQPISCVHSQKTFVQSAEWQFAPINMFRCRAYLTQLTVKSQIKFWFCFWPKLNAFFVFHFDQNWSVIFVLFLAENVKASFDQSLLTVKEVWNDPDAVATS